MTREEQYLCFVGNKDRQIIIDERLFAKRYKEILPTLDEFQTRRLLASDAKIFGRGGIKKVSELSGASRPTIYAGMKELEQGISPSENRVRRSGGGRKSITHSDPEIIKELELLVEPHTRGDPMSPLRWTTKGAEQLADELTKKGHCVKRTTVLGILHELKYSLKANLKTIEEGAQNVDRD